MYFHGAKDASVCRRIADTGEIRPGKTRRGFLAPRPGCIYLTKSLKNAAMYVLGGDVAGKDVSDWYNKGGALGTRYGCLAVVDQSQATRLEPDEDEVGELMADECIPWLTRMGERHLAPSTIRRAREGEYAYWAKAGKVLLKRMTPSQKKEVVGRTENVANCGPVKVKELWMFDKVKNPQLRPRWIKLL